MALTALRRHFISWSLTSERVIESKGILARHRREMELADVRSVDVEQRFMQRAMGLGNIIIASAASADYAIKLYDVPDPEGVAETLRRAGLRNRRTRHSQHGGVFRLPLRASIAYRVQVLL